MNADACTADTVSIPLTDHDPRRWLAFSVLLIGAFLPVLDFNIVNLALPSIQADLDATSAQVQFVISAYAATYAVFLITGGRLGDWLGRKLMFTSGVAGFTLASVLCGLAWSPAVLIAGRILQGLTATIMAPQVLACMRVLLPAHEQGKALGFYGATFGFANAMGPILGGILVSAHPFGFAWQAIFLVNVPIGLAAFTGALLFLQESKSAHARSLDIGGVLLLSATLGLLVYPLVEGRELGWPGWIIAMLAASPVTLAGFIRFERWLVSRGGSPLVEFALFHERGFTIGVVMALLYYMLSAFYLTVSVYFQNGMDLSPMAASLRILPFGAGFFGTSFAAATIMQRFGPRALTLGFAIQVIGFAIVILAVIGVQDHALEPGLAIAGIGFGIVTPSVIKAVIGGIDHRHAGLASGIVISTFQIGSALGIAIIGGVFFGVLGTGRALGCYAHAFAIALGCNVVLLAVGGMLSLWLPGGNIE